MGINLKKNLHYFEKEKLIDEIIKVNEWYDEFEELYELALDYRIKSIQSAILKYNRYYPDHQARHLSSFKRSIESKVGYDKIQLVTISRPSAYGEYEPYHFVNTEKEFVHAVEAM